MLGLYVTVPVASFRKGQSREYLETDDLPPPATCYGFLLSLVGETNRRRHVGCRVTAGLLAPTRRSVVLRTVWRVKQVPLGSSGNTRPDYQQLLCGTSATHPFVELAIWLDSSAEVNGQSTLEARVADALDPVKRGAVERFGGLCMGESTALVNDVSLWDGGHLQYKGLSRCRLFLLAPGGRLTLPVWVDHVGSAGTRYAVGDLIDHDLSEPHIDRLPSIGP